MALASAIEFADSRQGQLGLGSVACPSVFATRPSTSRCGMMKNNGTAAKSKRGSIGLKNESATASPYTNTGAKVSSAAKRRNSTGMPGCNNEARDAYTHASVADVFAAISVQP